MNIFFHKERFISVDVEDCSLCGKSIEKYAIYTVGWRKNKAPVKGMYCHNCALKIKSMANLDEYRLVHFVDSIPSAARPVFDSFPGLVQRGDATVWSSAQEPDGAKVVDRSRLAGRESWEGARIGRKMEQGGPLDVSQVRDHLMLLMDAELEKPKQLRGGGK